MATSGTVGTTVIDTAALLEHAFRRCGVPPSAQTPEMVLMAKENLYLLLLGLSNNGLNLWAVEKALMGLESGKPKYITPRGTLDVLNVLLATPTVVDSTDSDLTSGPTYLGLRATFTSSMVLRVGFSFNAAVSGAVVIRGDGVTLDTLPSEDTYVADQLYWHELSSLETLTSVDVLEPSGTSVSQLVSSIVVASAVNEIPLTQWNRDTYAAFPNKRSSGRPSGYFYEKKLIPEITLWPVPNDSNLHLTIYRHRQAEDVGTLVQQVEIPQRWMDGFIWLLAARLCFEVPSIDSGRQNMVLQMADKVVLEAEQSETDGAPIYLTPNIGVYNR